MLMIKIIQNIGHLLGMILLYIDLNLSYIRQCTVARMGEIISPIGGIEWLSVP